MKVGKRIEHVNIGYGGVVPLYSFRFGYFGMPDYLLVAYDPEDIRGFCRTLSEDVVLKMDYDD